MSVAIIFLRVEEILVMATTTMKDEIVVLVEEVEVGEIGIIIIREVLIIIIVVIVMAAEEEVMVEEGEDVTTTPKQVTTIEEEEETVIKVKIEEIATVVVVVRRTLIRVGRTRFIVGVKIHHEWVGDSREEDRAVRMKKESHTEKDDRGRLRKKACVTFKKTNVNH